MASIIGVFFSDFEKLIGKHRVYYFEGENYFDFHFLAEGMIVKTTLLKKDIENKEQFFASPMFYNSVRLTFRLPDPDSNTLADIEGIRQPLEAPISTIDEEQPEEVEVENDNIQKEGTL